MKFAIFIFFAGVIPLFSSETLYVKDGTVNIELNGKKKFLQAGNSVVLEECDRVKYLDGDGRVVVKNFSISANTPVKKINMPCKPNYLSILSDKFFATSEKKKFGTSLRGDESDDLNETLTLEIPSNDEKIIGKTFYLSKEFILISSKKFYPLPVLLNIYDNNKSVIYSISNTNDAISTFKIDMSIVEAGYQLEIKSMMTNEVLYKIIFE